MWGYSKTMTKTGKLVTSIQGTVRVADGTQRIAFKNIYEVVSFSPDGASCEKKQETRIEFLLFRNANARSGGKGYRKVTPKQAATFVAE